MGCTLPVKASSSCSSVQCNRSSPSWANFLASVSPSAKACRMRSPLAPSKLLTTIDSLMRISSSRHSIWFCSRTRSRVSCTFLRVRLRQIRCSPLGTKLNLSSSAISRRTSRSASLKSCLPPRGARLENACAKCKRRYGSRSRHTDRQYCAVDSLTAFSTPCSCNHIRNRCNSLGSVTNRRRAGFSSGTLASTTTSLKTFLCTSIPAIFIASSSPGSGRTPAKKVTHRPVLPPFLFGGGRDTDWFKTRVPDQTQKRPHFIQRENRPAPSTPHERTAQTQPDFHVNGWAAGQCETQNPPTAVRPKRQSP